MCHVGWNMYIYMYITIYYPQFVKNNSQQSKRPDIASEENNSKYNNQYSKLERIFFLLFLFSKNNN